MPGKGRTLPIFQNRRQAGRELANALREQADLSGAIVLALPRGGVPVAFETAADLHLPLDILLVRKLGVPGEEELAMGAVASGGIIVLHPEVMKAFGITQQTVDALIAREEAEIERREVLYRGGHPQARLENRTVALVDDGLATGATMRAAARALRPVAARVVAAVPVGAKASCDALAPEVDQLVCLYAPEAFHAVGEFYRNFEQVSDEEVRMLLELARATAQLSRDKLSK